MGTRHRFIAHAAAALIVLWCAALPAFPASVRADYEYQDDFSTDKAEIDSYSHSDILDEMPEIWLDGFLIYDGLPPDRALKFYGGFDPLMFATLCYRFPLSDDPYIITECEIGLSLLDCGGPFYVDECSEGIWWSTVGEIDVPGNYLLILDYSDEPLEGWQYLRFRSEAATLGSFFVSMSCTTPVEYRTWGMIKAFYR
jgi:hypothetical protein